MAWKNEKTKELEIQEREQQGDKAEDRTETRKVTSSGEEEEGKTTSQAFT